jgi:hypothetical protein
MIQITFGRLEKKGTVLFTSGRKKWGGWLGKWRCFKIVHNIFHFENFNHTNITYSKKFKQ